MNRKDNRQNNTNPPPCNFSPVEVAPFFCFVFFGAAKKMKENFYHPDHLSSSSWITDQTGYAIQHLQYLPFGELRVDQRTTSWNSRYTFSAKEKDAESGYGYFGARYYDSDLSIWISVDPMSDKYPSLSPYNYCANNPVKLVVPNGEDFIPIVDEEKKTITITATYYTTSENKARLQEGLDGWNKESGNYSFKSDNGDKYTINFDLKIGEGDFDNNNDAMTATMHDESGFSNYFAVGDPGEDVNGVPAQGKTLNGTDITVRGNASTRTTMHEIGHTLGIGEWFGGLMESGGLTSNIYGRNLEQMMSKTGACDSPTSSYFSNNPNNADTRAPHIGKSAIQLNVRGKVK